MAIGRKDPSSISEPLWVSHRDIAESPGHPFYERLNRLLKQAEFDVFCEKICASYYAQKMGRPSIPPGVYFRMLMLGYFEGIASERGIAWRCADSMSLRSFLGYAITENPPDHSSLSRIRHRLSLEVHKAVFQKVLEILKDAGLLKGKTLGIDASTMEANAAMRSILRKIDGQSYEGYLRELAEASGLDNPTKDDLAEMDRKRKDKTCSNKTWYNPNDPEARVTKMKDGRTHFAYKPEHGVDMDTGALVSVVMHQADQGDTQTGWGTLAEATENLDAVYESEDIVKKVVQECVMDRGYHSGPNLLDLEEVGIRSYIAEPDRGRRKWKAKGEKGEEKAKEQKAVYSNRRRRKGKRGKNLQRKRGELIERSFAHMLETGAMRRTWLRGVENIWKRYLIHACGFNLSLVMRDLYQVGTPRAMDALIRLLRDLFSRLVQHIMPKNVQILQLATYQTESATLVNKSNQSRYFLWATACSPKNITFSTGC
jgi:transposase